MLDDLTKEIKAQLYDRVKSPLFGAFALSWVAWNYRALLSVLSDLKFNEKLDYLDKLYPSWWDWASHCLLGPMVTAVLLLLLYPHPARWIYEYWANQQKELKKVQQKIEDDTPITQEEARALRKKSLVQAVEFESQISELRQQNKELRELLREASQENKKPLNIAELKSNDADTSSKNNLAPYTSDELTQKELLITEKVLLAIAKIGKGSTDDVAAVARIAPREAKGELLALLGDGLVARNPNEKWEIGQSWKITEKGKLAAARHPSYWRPLVQEIGVADQGKLEEALKIETAVTEEELEQNKGMPIGASSSDADSDGLPHQMAVVAPPKNTTISDIVLKAITRIGEASTEDIANITNQQRSLVHEELLQLAMKGVVRREKEVWRLTEHGKLLRPAYLL